jgi:ABC-type polysaccharide/polyol phosphate transport system ATPase subunit
LIGKHRLTFTGLHFYVDQDKENVMEAKPEATPVVEMRNIHKNFAAVQALKGVDLVLHHNEVLGLVGDNAAGKSTLMKVLSGAYIRGRRDSNRREQGAHNRPSTCPPAWN